MENISSILITSLDPSRTLYIAFNCVGVKLSAQNCTHLKTHARGQYGNDVKTSDTTQKGSTACFNTQLASRVMTVPITEMMVALASPHSALVRLLSPLAM